MELIGFSAETHQGPFLNLNEDSYSYDLDQEIFMVFDGFGGQGRGDQCVSDLQSNLKKFYGNFVVDRNSTLPFFYSPYFLPEGNALINAALNSHHQLFEANQKKPLSERSGASGVMIVKVESILVCMSVGNCRAFILRKGNILPIFVEDSFKYLSKDNFESHLKNIPLSGFGVFPDLYYQMKEARIVEGDKFLIVSDGVYGRLTDEELNCCVAKPSINIKKKVEDLFTLANSRGNLDNQTCMILEF